MCAEASTIGKDCFTGRVTLSYVNTNYSLTLVIRVTLPQETFMPSLSTLGFSTALTLGMMINIFEHTKAVILLFIKEMGCAETGPVEELGPYIFLCANMVS